MSKRTRHTEPTPFAASFARARSHSAMESMLASGASDLGSSPGVGSLLPWVPLRRRRVSQRRGRVCADPGIRLQK